MSTDAGGDSPEVVWRLYSQAMLHWRQWSDEWTVFDAGSGQTHLMDGLTALAVMALEAGPVTVPELVAQVTAEVQEVPRAGLETRLRDAFVRLSAADLIEPDLR